MFTIISLAIFFPAIFWLDKTCYPIVSQRGIVALFPTFFHSFKWFDWNFYKTWRIAWLNINSWAQNSFFECIRYWFTCFGQWNLWRNLRSAFFFHLIIYSYFVFGLASPQIFGLFLNFKNFCRMSQFWSFWIIPGSVCTLYSKGKTHEIRHVIFGIKRI